MPRIDTAQGGRHISMEQYERREARAELDAASVNDDRRPRNVEFARMMQSIRAAYTRHIDAGKHDGAAFDALVEESGVYEMNRWPRHHVTNALIRISAKAKFLNERYFGGRFK